MALPDETTWRARGQVESVADLDVFFIDEGTGPAIVYLHGYPTSSHDLAPVLPWLTADHRVIGHDHIGFGLSAKPPEYSYSLVEQADIALLLWRTLGVERAHIVAHDYGTSVATEILARRERMGIDLEVTGVTLCNGSTHIELTQLRLIQRLLLNRTVGPLVARLSSQRVFNRNMRAIVAGDDVYTDAELRTMWSMLTANGGKARLPQITQYIAERYRFWHRWIGALTRLDLPCHIVWGDRDPVAVNAIAEAMAAETPGAELEWLDGLGHYPMIEDPERWATAVLGFIDR